MHRRYTLIGIILILSINLSGCWDSHDLEGMSLPIAAAYDLHDGSKNLSDVPEELKSQHWIDVTVLNQNLSKEADTKVRVEKESSPFTAFARNRRPLTSGRFYQPAVNQVAIFGKELSQAGLNPFLDGGYRVPVISNIVNVAVTDKRGEDILNTRVDDFTNAGTLLRDLLLKASHRAFVLDTTLHDILINNAPGKNPVMPMVKQTGDKEGIEITGSAIFNKDKMIDTINIEETRSLVLLRGIKSNGMIPFVINENGEIIDSGTVSVSNKRKVIVTRQGDYYIFLIKIKLKGILDDHTNNTSKLTEQKFHAIEKQIESDIKGDCAGFISKMQKEWEVDSIDISKYALAKWRKELTPIIDKDFIQNTCIQVEVEVNLYNAGVFT